MTVIEYAPDASDILDFVDQSLRNLQEAAIEPKYILAGPAAYKLLRKSIGQRFRRGAGEFETYQFIPIVLDPARDDTLLVLPSPAECEKGVQLVRP